MPRNRVLCIPRLFYLPALKGSGAHHYNVMRFILLVFLSVFVSPLFSQGSFTKDHYDILNYNGHKLLKVNLNNLEWMFQLTEAKWKEDMMRFELSSNGYEAGCPYVASVDLDASAYYQKYALDKCQDMLKFSWMSTGEKVSLLDDLIAELEPYKQYGYATEHGYMYKFEHGDYLYRIDVTRNDNFEFVIFGKTPLSEYLLTYDSRDCQYGRCIMIKSDGNRCKNCRQDGSLYCWSHNHQ